MSSRFPFSVLALVAACSGSKPGTSCPGGQVKVDGECRSICTRAADCPTGQTCRDDVCVPGQPAPHIEGVTGDGSSDGASGHAAAHVRAGLEITGTSLDGATVSLAAVDAGLPSFASLTVRAGATDTAMSVDLPAAVVQGHYQLRVENASGSDEVATYVLQGETGPAGASGANGVDGANGTCDPTACSSSVLPGTSKVTTLGVGAASGGTTEQSFTIDGVEQIRTPQDGVWLGVLSRSTHQLDPGTSFNRSYDPATQMTELVVALRSAALASDIVALVSRGPITADVNTVLSTGTSLADELVALGASERVRELGGGDAFALVGYPGVGEGNAALVVSTTGEARATVLLADGTVMGPRTHDDVGTVGLGSIIAHTTNLAGSTPIAVMQKRGFALCDGTTPESQGITGAAITAAMPDLNGGTRFLRGASASGVLQGDQLQDHTHSNSFSNGSTSTNHAHSYDDNSGWSSCGTPSGTDCNAPSGIYESGNRSDISRTSGASAPSHTHTLSGSVGYATSGSHGTETRPSNMSVVWMMRVK